MKWALVFLFADVGQIYETGLVYRDLESCRMVAAQLREDANERYRKINKDSLDMSDRRKRMRYDVFLDQHIKQEMVCLPTK